MGRLSLPLGFAIALSFSITTSSSYSLSFSLKPTSPSSPPPKASASDLLTLLGPQRSAAVVDRGEANQLRSCFRFLIPLNRIPFVSGSEARRSLAGVESKEDELIWWPPAPVLELARIAFDSGGDLDVIHRTLDPTVLPVPDVEGSEECHCELTRTPYSRRFINEEINSYLMFLFEMIVSRGPSMGLNVSLSRYDFFHGHIFISRESGRLGVLFHAKEYPAYEKEIFPYNMGYCQRGLNVAYDDMMNLRNILWLAPLPSNNSSKSWESPGNKKQGYFCRAHGKAHWKFAQKMRRPFYMNSVKAREFGVIDKILWRGQEQMMSDVAPPEYWDKNANIRELDPVRFLLFGVPSEVRCRLLSNLLGRADTYSVDTMVNPDLQWPLNKYIIAFDRREVSSFQHRVRPF